MLTWDKTWVFRLVIATLVAIFCLDRATGAAPVQHLYYLPIILSGLTFGYRGGACSALAAIALYHFADDLTIRSLRHADSLQIALFLLVGGVAGKLSSDARELHRLANTDDLTGLRNLRSFEAELESWVRRLRKNNQPLSLLTFDVDRLKRLNDHHGHLAGSEAVRAVGQVVAESFGEDAVACRYGGDEFVIALPYTSVEAAEECAQRLCQSVRSTAPLLLGRTWPPGTLSISVGVACCCFMELPPASGRGTEDEGEALFKAADQALYRAKANGRNRVEVAREPGDRVYSDPARP
jgi:diguanylate cyclase (GGDEF)-like protein